MTGSPKRRGDKRERTRRKLIAAAQELISERGFAQTSLEAVARRAGVTRGSIYSNFASRDDLIMAAVTAQGMTLDRDFSRKAPLARQLRHFAEELFDQFPAAARGGALVTEYQLYAMSQPKLRAQLVSIYEGMFAKMTADFARQYAAELAIAPEALARSVQALAMGLVWQFMLTPGEVRRADVIAAFDALARGAMKRSP